MGAGISQVALEAGWSVALTDSQAGAADRGRDRIADGLRRRAAKQGAQEAWTSEILERLTLAPDPETAASGADLVIEAIVEDLDSKLALFGVLDAVADPATILATNTSALPVTAIAEGARAHPERVLGLHFFNPAPVLVLVEVVAARRTSPIAVDRAIAFMRSWCRRTVRSADSPGFIVNRVNRPFTIEALRMLESGQAGVVAIDGALRSDGFPMGPFELMDLVGLDVNLAAATGIWEGLGCPERLRPSPIQEWLVARGRLGRKSGRGFYRYQPGGVASLDPLPSDLARPAGDVSVLAGTDIVRRIRSAIAAEAMFACNSGTASDVDIDTALRLGAAHPQGPFAWARQSS